MGVLVENGHLLLADPFMMDNNFKRSVILVCDRHTEGTVGFILNKPMNAKVHEILEDFPDSDLPLFFGGPVAHDTIHFVHNKGDIIDNSMPIDANLYWGGDYEQIKQCMKDHVMTKFDIRFFIGYSGWSSGQLEEELAYHSWVVSRMDYHTLFSLKIKSMWSDVMHAKGGNFKVISTLSDFSNLN